MVSKPQFTEQEAMDMILEFESSYDVSYYMNRLKRAGYIKKYDDDCPACKGRGKFNCGGFMPQADSRLSRFFFNDGTDGIQLAEHMCRNFLNATIKKGMIIVPKVTIDVDETHSMHLTCAGWEAVEYLCDEWDYVCEYKKIEDGEDK